MTDKKYIVEIDGNDGVGKTYLIEHLSDDSFFKENTIFLDRGQFTKLTDGGVFKREECHIYIILDALVEVCQERILKRGDSLSEKYHTREDLEYYRQRFLDLAKEYSIPVISIDSDKDIEKVKKIIKSKIFSMEKLEARNLVVEKTGVEFDKLTLDEFRKLPLFIEGESKEIRLLNDEIGIIYFKPTIYSFTANRTGVVEGSNIPRVKVSSVLCEVLKKHGINHAYIDYADEFVITHIVKNPNIEIVVKANHTGTSKHRYYGMNQMTVRESHPLYAGMPIKDMDAYPVPIVRFDWRNPFQHPETKVPLADEVLGEEQADWFIDVKEARKTASLTFSVLQDFLNDKDIMVYDLCLFITEDGKTVYGEISPDCGRYRHYDLGSLDKDVWRSGGSSKDVLDKWNLLYDMICKV